MTVRSDQLADHAADGAGAIVVLATVPEGETWLLKSARLRTNSGAGLAVLFITTNSGASFGLLETSGIDDLRVEFGDAWDALVPGNTISVYADAGQGSVFALVSGAKLVGVVE